MPLEGAIVAFIEANPGAFEKGSHRLEVRVVGPTGLRLAAVTGSVVINEPSLPTRVAIPMPLMIQSFGMCSIEVAVGTAEGSAPLDVRPEPS